MTNVLIIMPPEIKILFTEPVRGSGSSEKTEKEQRECGLLRAP